MQQSFDVRRGAALVRACQARASSSDGFSPFANCAEYRREFLNSWVSCEIAVPMDPKSKFPSKNSSSDTYNSFRAAEEHVGEKADGIHVEQDRKLEQAISIGSERYEICASTSIVGEVERRCM